MKKDELLNLMKKHLGADAEKSLLDSMRRNGIKDIENSTKDKIRQLAKDIKNSIPAASLAKKNLIFSEIVKILGLDIDNLGKDKFEDESIRAEVEAEKDKVEKFVKKIDRSLTKYETIFNLFWKRAGEAELGGVRHEDVLRITKKALVGIKKDLESYKEEIMAEYDILEKSNKMIDDRFQFYRAEMVRSKAKKKNEIELANKKMVKDTLHEFWEKVEDTYIIFNRVFMESMNKDIELRKRGLDDEELVKETQDKMLKLWDSLDRSYKEFEENMKTVVRKIKENIVKGNT